jgi:hypothetical protein
MRPTKPGTVIRAKPPMPRDPVHVDLPLDKPVGMG